MSCGFVSDFEFATYRTRRSSARRTGSPSGASKPAQCEDGWRGYMRCPVVDLYHQLSLLCVLHTQIFARVVCSLRGERAQGWDKARPRLPVVWPWHLALGLWAQKGVGCVIVTEQDHGSVQLREVHNSKACARPELGPINLRHSRCSSSSFFHSSTLHQLRASHANFPHIHGTQA